MKLIVSMYMCVCALKSVLTLVSMVSCCRNEKAADCAEFT